MKEGALQELPGGWVWTRLGEIVNVTSGYGFPEKYQGKTTGEIPFFKVMDISKSVLNGSRVLKVANNYISKKDCKEIRANPLRKGTIVFAKIGEAIKLNRRVILEQDSLVDNNVMGIYPYNETLDNLFAFFFLSTVKLGDYSRATTVPSVRKSDVEQISFPLPPLPEQRTIVSKIEQLFSDLDNGIENFKKTQGQLKLYRQSVLKAACEGKLVPTEAELVRAKGRDYEPADVLLERILRERREKWNGKGKYKEADAPNTNGLPALPEGWCWVNLEQLKSFSLYGPRYSSEDYANDGYIVLRTSDIGESGKVDISSAPRLNISKEDFSKYKVELGDLLITRTGSLGTLAIFNDNVEAIPGAYLIMYRLVMTFEISWYIFYFLKSTLGQKHLIGGGAGVGRPNLNAPTIEAISIPLPPLAEQRRIVAEIERRLTISDKMEETITDSLQKAEALRQSILKKSFEGKLLNERELKEVRKAPDWEPAEKLLERIKAENKIVSKVK